MITLEECLKVTSEATCFDYADPFRDGCKRMCAASRIGTILRNYPRCHRMHFWRGFIEFVALLCSAQFLLFQFHDRNSIQLEIMEQMNAYPSNRFIRREVLSRSLLEKEHLLHKSDEEQVVV